MTESADIGLTQAKVQRSTVHHDLARRSVHGAAATMLSQGIRFITQFGAQVALARMLVPAEFGIVAMTTPFVGFVQILTDLGLLQATVQKPRITQAELSGLFWVSLGVSAMLALLLILAAPIAGWLYGEPRVVGVMAALGSLLVFGGLAAQPMAIMNRTMRFVPLAIIDITAALAAAVAGITAAGFGCGYWSLVMMQAANAITIVVLAWIFSGWRPSWPERVAGFGELVRFGGTVTATNVINYLSYTMDNVLIGARWGEIQLGFYDRGFRLMLLPVVQIIIPFTRVAVPLLSRLQDDAIKYRLAYVRVIRALLLTTTPAIVFAIAMAHTLLVSVLGARWTPAVPIFAWLGLGALLVPINLSMGWLFVSQHRVRQQFVCCCAGTIILVVGFVAGLPWGATGVAAATAIVSWTMYAPLLWWMATRAGPVRLHDLAGVLYPIVLGGCASWVALLFLRDKLPAAWPFGLPIALVVAYVVMVLVVACLPRGWHALREIWELHTMFVPGGKRAGADT